MSTDRIEKSVLLRAPRARVWRALTDAREFGAWFGFDAVPLARRAKAYRMNEEGWAMQMQAVDRHVAAAR